MEKKSFNTPDAVDSPDKIEVKVVKVGDVTFKYLTIQPGWSWEESIKPSAGTESCELPHTEYFISGKLHIKMDDGSEMDFGPGDVGVIPPGHNAWVVGDEPVEAIDLSW